MKLLVFAHTPPPHHGQSYAVKLMLESFGGDRRKPAFRRLPPNHFGIECYHVNARFSRTLEEIGEIKTAKILLVFYYCLQAIWCRLRYGVECFYYVPAPGKRVALYRDWLVMLLCRPFFRKTVFHWHSVGLARWLETVGSMRLRSFTYDRMKNADLSIVLSDFNRRDAEKLTARRIAVVAGGIPDPCPEFASEILPRRQARMERWRRILSGQIPDSPEGDRTVRVLYLALVSREKGAFDAVEAVAAANRLGLLRFRLTMIGGFASRAEEAGLHELISRLGVRSIVDVLGFVPADRKNQALCEADLFCFPTYYLAEGQPANLIEALAYGLPMVTTRWRAIPEMLPPEFPGLVDPRSPDQIAGALQRLAVTDCAAELRQQFLRRFTLEQYLANMAQALRSIETD